MSSISKLPELVAEALRTQSDLQFPSFVIDQVLDTHEYRKLLDCFPQNLIKGMPEDGGASYEFKSNASIPSELPLEWRQLVDVLKSFEIKQRLVATCFPALLKRYPGYIRWLLFFRLRSARNYDVNLALNVSYCGRFLPPHTDNSYKALALVLYFADFGYSSVIEGTRFFSSNSKTATTSAVRRFNRLADSRVTQLIPLSLQPMTSCNIWNHAKSVEEQNANEAWFLEHFTNDFSVEFRANRIAGFIKTQNSWHSVDMRESVLIGPRRSLLINLNLKHSLAARIGQKFRARVLRLST